MEKEKVVLGDLKKEERAKKLEERKAKMKMLKVARAEEFEKKMFKKVKRQERYHANLDKAKEVKEAKDELAKEAAKREAARMAKEAAAKK